MQSEKFNQVIAEQLARSESLLKSKNSAYNPGGDKLRGFKTAADMQNQTARAALAGMMAKHTVSVFDMCHSDEIFPVDVWNEKLTDHINYLLLLRAVVEEEIGEDTIAFVGGEIDTYHESADEFKGEAGDLTYPASMASARSL